MKLAVLLACVAASAAAQDSVGSRIAQSAAAAERLQGPLDGAWTLTGADGRVLAYVQIGDPPDGKRRGAISCAWRRPRENSAPAICRREGGRLSLALGDARVVLRRARGGAWRGHFRHGNTVRTVSLRRR